VSLAYALVKNFFHGHPGIWNRQVGITDPQRLFLRSKNVTYGINNATASVHLRLPKSLLAEMKVICAEEDCGGMSALVRRALRQYILTQHKQGSAPQQIKSAAPKQTITEYGAATTSNDDTSNNQVQHTDDPYIPDFIKNAPGFDKEAWLKFRA
jgi:hypothetical protein